MYVYFVYISDVVVDYSFVNYEVILVKNWCCLFNFVIILIGDDVLDDFNL